MKYEWNIDKIREAVKTSINISEVLEKLSIPRLGNNSTTLKRILEKYDIDYTHFTGRARSYKPAKVSNIDDYLSNKTKVSTHLLKRVLFKSGYKSNKCELCGITSWNGKPLICLLHHINGNHLDNRLENLLILCPNCHSQTDNYCGSANITKKHVRYCVDCGKEISATATRCTICSFKHRRKVERPTKEVLLKELEGTSFCEVGRRYGVSDNAVRKWIK